MIGVYLPLSALRGDDFTFAGIIRDDTGAPIDLTAYTPQFIVKSAAGIAGTALIDVGPSVDPDENGVTYLDDDGAFEVLIKRADILALSGSLLQIVTLAYGFNFTATDDRRETLMHGPLLLIPGVTQ